MGLFESRFLARIRKRGDAVMCASARSLTPLQAIQVATLNAAKLLHIADQCGTLEVGQKANFIVLEKNPSEDIHITQTIRAIWKNGKKFSDGPLAAGTTAMQ